MAYKTVLTADAREKVRKFLRDVAAEKGSLYLALLAQTLPEVGDKWTLIVSAPWVDSSGRRATVSYLSSNLSRYLDKHALSVIDRIEPMSRTELFVENILTNNDSHSLEEPVRHFTNWHYRDAPIQEGYIFVVDPDAKMRHTRSAAGNRKVVAR
jgi:hypothetical protein